jgi:hypothetical protein
MRAGAVPVLESWQGADLPHLMQSSFLPGAECLAYAA